MDEEKTGLRAHLRTFARNLMRDRPLLAALVVVLLLIVAGIVLLTCHPAMTACVS